MSSTRSPIVFLAALAACMLFVPASALAHHAQSTVVATAPASCAGAADSSLTPTRVITGEFDTSLEGGYVLLPFIVDPPAPRPCGCATATTSRRRRRTPASGTCWTWAFTRRRSAPGALWALPEFRGWGGSSHPDVTVSRNGFSSEAQYLTNPKLHRQGRTTRGFLPGPIPAGEWAVELGVAAVASQLEGDSDGKVAWRVEIETSTDPLWEQDPYAPASYDEAPARSDARLVRRATSTCTPSIPRWATRRCARRSTTRSPAARDAGGCARRRARLRHPVRLRDDSAWGEIGRHQADHPGKLIIRSSEIITYQGHTNNHASHTYVDYRTGPVYERHEDGIVEQRRPAPPGERALRRGERRRWLHPDQPPDDLPLGGPGLRLPLPRLPLGLHGRGHRLLQGRCDRDRDRAGGAPAGPEPGAEPVHARWRSSSGRTRSTPAAATATTSRRSARATRTTPAARRTRCTQAPIGTADHGRLRATSCRRTASQRA